MYIVKQITSDAKQKHTLILPNGNQAIVTFEYRPMQLGWFISITYGTFIVNNMRVVTSPNMLHQYKNQIPFGIGVFVDGNQEPLLQEDFSQGRARFYLLDSTEIALYGSLLSG